MGHSILIIDDDAGTRTLLTGTLQTDGYTTVTAENGAEAVRRLVEAKPCVILLDFDMPVMDGHDFREVQKRVAPDVPIICLTGAADAEMTARRVGASSVHQKPLDVDALRRAVAELCRLPHAHRHTPEVECSIAPGTRCPLGRRRRRIRSSPPRDVPARASLCRDVQFVRASPAWQGDDLSDRRECAYRSTDAGNSKVPPSCACSRSICARARSISWSESFQRSNRVDPVRWLAPMRTRNASASGVIAAGRSAGRLSGTDIRHEDDAIGFLGHLPAASGTPA